MAIHDISLVLSESLPVGPGGSGFRLVSTSHLDLGDVMTVSYLEMGAHMGTHVDAPAHFIRSGRTVEALDLDVLIGPALVVHAPHAHALSASLLEALGLPASAERVLFRTRNSQLWGQSGSKRGQDFVAITADGARWLVDHGIRLVGLDSLSVAPYDEPVLPHQILLGAGVIALEGLNLSDIRPGEYLLVCLPLQIAGAEGAPARAVLMDRDDLCRGPSRQPCVDAKCVGLLSTTC